MIDRQGELSLTIGTAGRIIETASQRAGWEVMLMTREELNGQLDTSIDDFRSIPGAPDEFAEKLVEQGLFTFADLSRVEIDDLARLSESSPKESAAVIDYALRHLDGRRPEVFRQSRIEKPGGDGVIRRLEFLRPLRVSILSERRGQFAPFGLNGGPPGAIGKNTLQRAGSLVVEDLGGKVQIEVKPGDILTIATPGGGAFIALPQDQS